MFGEYVRSVDAPMRSFLSTFNVGVEISLRNACNYPLNEGVDANSYRTKVTGTFDCRARVSAL